MKILTKTPVAILIMVAVILSSGLLGCRRSLLSLRSTAEDYFYNGDGDGNSIQSDLEYIGATANNLKTIAVRYIDSSDKTITDLVEARTALASTKTISEKYSAAQKLFDAVTTLHDALDPDKMNSTDKNFRSSLYDDIRSAMQRISHNGYNDAAREFNEVLEHFPAKLIAGIVGIEPIPLYG